MSSIVDEKPPNPPNATFLLAIALELGIVGDLIVNRSVFGLLLCVAYAWFSATWHALFRD